MFWFITKARTELNLCRVKITKFNSLKLNLHTWNSKIIKDMWKKWGEKIMRSLSQICLQKIVHINLNIKNDTYTFESHIWAECGISTAFRPSQHKMFHLVSLNWQIFHVCCYYSVHFTFLSMLIGQNHPSTCLQCNAHCTAQHCTCSKRAKWIILHLTWE